METYNARCKKDEPEPEHHIVSYMTSPVLHKYPYFQSFHLLLDIQWLCNKLLRFQMSTEVRKAIQKSILHQIALTKHMTSRKNTKETEKK